MLVLATENLATNQCNCSATNSYEFVHGFGNRERRAHFIVYNIIRMIGAVRVVAVPSDGILNANLTIGQIDSQYLHRKRRIVGGVIDNCVLDISLVFVAYDLKTFMKAVLPDAKGIGNAKVATLVLAVGLAYCCGAVFKFQYQCGRKN